MILEQLAIELGIDASRLTAGLRAAETQVATSVGKMEKDAGESLRRLEGNMMSVGGAMTAGITVPITAMAVTATKSFADFKTALNTTSAQGDITGAALERLKNQAIDLGAKTKFSATEAAEGMATFAASGKTADEIFAAMPGTLNLAAAGQTSVGDAAKITGDLIAQLGLKAEDTDHVVDVLASTMTSGSSSVTQLGDALKYAAPVAAKAGLDIHDLNAALIVLDKAGIRGEQAGTSLRSMLISLQAPTDKAKSTMQQLGIATTDASGAMLPFDEVIDNVKAGIEKLASPTEQVAALNRIFGDNALTAAQILTNKGGPALAQYADQLRNSDGAAKRIADTMQQGLPGALERTTGAVETAGIAVGEKLAPSLIKLLNIVESGADMVVSLADWFGKLPEPIQLAALGTVALVAAIGPLLLGIGALIGPVTAAIELLGLGGLAGVAGAAGAGGALASMAAVAASVAAPALVVFGAAAAAIALWPLIQSVVDLGVEVGKMVFRIQDAEDANAKWSASEIQAARQTAETTEAMRAREEAFQKSAAATAGDGMSLDAWGLALGRAVDNVRALTRYVHEQREALDPELIKAINSVGSAWGRAIGTYGSMGNAADQLHSKMTTLTGLTASNAGAVKQLEARMLELEAAKKTGVISTQQYTIEYNKLQQRLREVTSEAPKTGLSLRNVGKDTDTAKASASDFSRVMDDLSKRFGSGAKGDIEAYRQALAAILVQLQNGEISIGQYSAMKADLTEKIRAAERALGNLSAVFGIYKTAAEKGKEASEKFATALQKIETDGGDAVTHTRTLENATEDLAVALLKVKPPAGMTGIDAIKDTIPAVRSLADEYKLLHKQHEEGKLSQAEYIEQLQKLEQQMRDAGQTGTDAFRKIQQEIRKTDLSPLQKAFKQFKRDVQGIQADLGRGLTDIIMGRGESRENNRQVNEQIKQAEAEAAQKREQLAEETADIRAALGERLEEYQDHVEELTATYREAEEAYAETLEEEQADLEKSLKKRSQELDEYITEVSEQAVEQRERVIKEAAKELKELQRSLDDKQKDYDEYGEDIDTKLARMAEDYKRSLTDEKKDLQRNIRDRTTAYTRFAEDVADENRQLTQRLMTEGADLSASERARIEKDIADNNTALARKKADLDTYIADQQADFEAWEKERKAEYDRDVADANLALERKTEDHEQYKLDILAKQNEIKEGEAAALLAIETETAESIAERKSEYEQYKLDAIAAFEAIKAAEAEKLAAAKLALETGLTDAATEYADYKTAAEAELAAIETASAAMAAQLLQDVKDLKRDLQTPWDDILGLGKKAADGIATAFLDAFVTGPEGVFGQAIGALIRSDVFKPLVDAAVTAGQAIAGILGDAVSGVGSTVAGGATSATGGAGGVAGAAGSALSGLTGIVTAIGSIGSAIGSIATAFISAGMANDLGEQGRTLINIENYLGSRGDGGIVKATQQSAASLSYLHTDVQKSLVPDLQLVKGDTAAMRLSLGTIDFNTFWSLKKLEDIHGWSGGTGILGKIEGGIVAMVEEFKGYRTDFGTFAAKAGPSTTINVNGNYVIGDSQIESLTDKIVESMRRKGLIGG